MDVCKVSEISLRQSRINKFKLLTPGQPGRMRTSLRRVLGKNMSSCRSTRSGQIGATLSLDCRVYSLKTEHLKERYGPLSPSTYWVMLNMDSRGIRFITWEHGQELVRESVPRFSEKDSVIELEPCPHSEDSLGHPRLLHLSLWQIRDRPIFGNHSFFVIPYRGRIRVYCFDKNFVLANENLSYREKREEKARARKAKIHRERSSSQNLRGCPNMASCR